MNDSQTPPPKRDVGFLAIAGLVAIVSVWLLLTPFVSSIARMGLERFHLGSSSFAVWSAQFPIPSMYNFANRYEVSEIPPGLVDVILPIDNRRYINHFPSRVVTFADTRGFHLAAGEDRWFHIESRYRGQTIETSFHLQPLDQGGFTVARLGFPAEVTQE